MGSLRDLADATAGWVNRHRVKLAALLVGGLSGYLAASPYSDRPEVAAVQSVLKGVLLLLGGA